MRPTSSALEGAALRSGSEAPSGPADGRERAPLLSVRGLTTHFPIHRGLLRRRVGEVRAVDGISFDIAHGGTLSLVGESGCGKTTAGRSLLRLIEPTAGEAWWAPEPGVPAVDLLRLSPGALRLRRRELQIIFQDPYASLNPRITVANTVGEALRLHGIAKGSELDDQVAALLRRVGLSPELKNRYPHEFSGGQRQRIGIARALALKPRFIVCDEAVSALDVSIQAQVLNLLEDLQQEFGLSYLFIAHDLSVVRHLSDQIAVMYLGRIVERAPTRELFETPLHPYTQALLSAVPRPHPGRRSDRIVLTGDVPSPIDPPPGCHFQTRCPLAQPRCREVYPELKLRGDRQVACHLVE